MYTIEEFDKEKSRVLKFILYKKRAKQEVKKKFNKSIEEEMLNDIILELEEIGYINDEKYIKRTIDEFKVLRNLSIKEIKYKLYSKGVSSNDIENYISSNIDDLMEYELESAKKIVFKKSETMDKINVIQFLAKKGYSQETVREAIKEMDD